VYLGQINNVTGVALLFEKGAYAPGTWEDATGENFRQSTSSAMTAAATKDFHFDGKNFVFADGHAKWSQRTAGPFASKGGPGGGAGECTYPGDQPAGDWPPAN
jgi:prepilin-type processing-associated H-X9-DG protein